MFRNAYRRFADGHESMLNNYTVSANSVAGIRWFELRRTQPGNWSIFQQSTYQPDTTWRWMGGIASDNQGNVALGFSASSSSISPQIRYAGRLATDPLNTLSGEQHLFDGTGSQSATSNRWGDYSDLTVDPVDDCTFYYTNEYYQTTSSFNWRTRIGYFRFAECTAPQKGTAHFIVTACTGGAPISNASVSIDGRPYGATFSNGTYDAALSPGSHSYSVSKAGVGTQSGNFTITNGQTTSVNLCLGSNPSPTPTATCNGHRYGDCYGDALLPRRPQQLRLQQLYLRAQLPQLQLLLLQQLQHRLPLPAQSPSLRLATKCRGETLWTSLGAGRLRPPSIFIATARCSSTRRTTVSTPIPSVTVAMAPTRTGCAKRALKRVQITRQ